MSGRLCPAIMLLSLLAGCGGESGPPVVISDVRIFAPLPGSAAGVAYLTVTNNGAETISIVNTSSPQFDRVEMHETVLEDGVSRMHRLESVVVPTGESVSFAAGGKHLMLMGAKQGANAGSPVTLEITHDGGLLIVSATMQTRLPGE